MHESWNGDDLARWAADADLVWSYGGGCAPDLLKGERLKLLKNCGAIVRTGSGTDNVDIEMATQLGIIVANTPQAVTESLSDHSISLLFSLVRQIPPQDRLLRGGTWNYRLAPPGRLLTGATWGLVGFGRGPRRMVEKLRGFDMNFLAYDPYVPPEIFQSRGVKSASLEEVFRTSDWVSLHCPLTKGTFHLIGERELGWLQPHALLVNTARGAVVDEPALIRARQEGRLSGAALDVFEKEPPDADNPLFKMANVIATPHVSGYDKSNPRAALEATVEAILDLSEHRWPYSYVNPGVVPRWGTMLPRREG
jgi:D-3-phosphoglycerate dehydrogenase / 2-oxoglutarate reductase